MHISDLLGAQQAGSVESIAQQSTEDKEEAFLPPSWGGDTVTFSAEARVLQQSSSSTPKEKEEDTSGKEAAAELSETIKKATGGGSSGSGSTSTSALEALEKRLKELQSRLAQVASSSMPEEAKEGVVASLNAQISQVSAQIGELKAEAEKQA